MQDTRTVLYTLRRSHAARTSPDALAILADIDGILAGDAWDACGELLRGHILTVAQADVVPANAGKWATLSPDTKAKLSKALDAWIRKAPAAILVPAT
jgi:hypothetical protein